MPRAVAPICDGDQDVKQTGIRLGTRKSPYEWGIDSFTRDLMTTV